MNSPVTVRSALLTPNLALNSWATNTPIYLSCQPLVSRSATLGFQVMSQAQYHLIPTPPSSIPPISPTPTQPPTPQPKPVNPKPQPPSLAESYHQAFSYLAKERLALSTISDFDFGDEYNASVNVHSILIGKATLSGSHRDVACLGVS